MTLKSTEDFERRQRNQFASRRAITDFVMGVLIAIAGLFFLTRQFFAISLNKQFPPDYLDKLLGGLFLVYGVWRIYRGYKKKYFR